MDDRLEPGFFYHIYNRGNNHENVYVEERNYPFFLDLLFKHLVAVCDVYCYCLLKNHFHLIVRIKDIEDLPIKLMSDKNRLHQPFSNFFNAYTKSFNKLYFRSGSLFQKNFNKIRIMNENYLRNVVLYVHLNPVKHGFTTEYSKYEFSSYQQIISDRPCNLMKEDVIQLFDDIENFIYCHDHKKIDFDGIIGEIDELDS